MPELNPNGASDTEVKTDDGMTEMVKVVGPFRSWPVMNR